MIHDVSPGAVFLCRQRRGGNRSGHFLNWTEYVHRYLKEIVTFCRASFCPLYKCTKYCNVFCQTGMVSKNKHQMEEVRKRRRRKLDAKGSGGLQ